MRRRPDSERLYVLLGRKLERQRRVANLSQTQLAQRCGLARGSIANIESGNQRVTLHTLWLIAEVLGIDAQTLLPTRDEFYKNDARTVLPQITGRLRKVAGQSQNQVAVFIASSREEVSPDVDED